MTKKQCIRKNTLRRVPFMTSSSKDTTFSIKTQTESKIQSHGNGLPRDRCLVLVGLTRYYYEERRHQSHTRTRGKCFLSSRGSLVLFACSNCRCGHGSCVDCSLRSWICCAKTLANSACFEFHARNDGQGGTTTTTTTIPQVPSDQGSNHGVFQLVTAP